MGNISQLWVNFPVRYLAIIIIWAQPDLPVINLACEKV